MADQTVTGAPDGGPGEAVPVVEYIVQTRTTWGTRVHADGAAEEFVDDASRWQPLVRIAVEEVTSLLEYARDEGFFDLPSALEETVEADGGTRVRWTLVRPGGEPTERHTVQASGAQSDPLLLALNDRLQLAVGRALNRQADANS